MTCVLTSNWDPLGNTLGWPPMNQNFEEMPEPAEEFAADAANTLDNESRSISTLAGSRKRISKASQRNISTLSATQLERKRANDRDAQRAIRKRTREHIENLERTNEELRALRSSDQQRILELERENAYLRQFQSEAVLPRRLQEVEVASLPDHSMLPVEASSPAASVSRSDPGCSTTPQPSSSLRHRVLHNVRAAGHVMSPHDSLVSNLSIPSWRPHGSDTSMTSAPRNMSTLNGTQAEDLFHMTGEQWPNMFLPRQSTERSSEPIPQEYYSYSIDRNPQQAHPSHCKSPSAPSGISETPSYQPEYHQQNQPPLQADFRGTTHASPVPHSQTMQEMSSKQMHASGAVYASLSGPSMPYPSSPVDPLYQVQMSQGLSPFGDNGRGTLPNTSYPHGPSI